MLKRVTAPPSNFRCPHKLDTHTHSPEAHRRQTQPAIPEARQLLLLLAGYVMGHNQIGGPCYIHRIGTATWLRLHIYRECSRMGAGTVQLRPDTERAAHVLQRSRLQYAQGPSTSAQWSIFLDGHGAPTPPPICAEGAFWPLWPPFPPTPSADSNLQALEGGRADPILDSPCEGATVWQIRSAFYITEISPIWALEQHATLCHYMPHIPHPSHALCMTCLLVYISLRGMGWGGGGEPSLCCYPAVAARKRAQKHRRLSVTPPDSSVLACNQREPLLDLGGDPLILFKSRPQAGYRHPGLGHGTPTLGASAQGGGGGGMKVE